MVLKVSTVNTFITVACDDEEPILRRNSSCPPELSSCASSTAGSTPTSATRTMPTFSPKSLWSDASCLFEDDWLRPTAVNKANVVESDGTQHISNFSRTRYADENADVSKSNNRSSRDPRRQAYPKTTRTYGHQSEVPEESIGRKVYVSEDPWSEVITVFPDGKKKKPTKMHMATGPRYLCTFYVGIADEPTFTVAKRIIGPKGHKMKWIAEQAQAGAKIRLRGKGSMFKERDTGYESSAPLQINISVSSREGYERTKVLVADLLNDIYNDYFSFCGREVRVAMCEDPRNAR